MPPPCVAWTFPRSRYDDHTKNALGFGVARKSDEICDEIDLIVRIQHEAARPGHPRFSTVRRADPVGKRCALALTHGAAPLESNPWEETLVRRTVSDEIVQSLEQAESFALPDVG